MKRSTEEILKEIQEELGIPEEKWKSKEGIEKRKRLLEETEKLGRDLYKMLDEPINKKKKADKINKYLKASQYVAAMMGVIGFLFKSHFSIPTIAEFIGGQRIKFNPGGTFWLEIAIFIFIIRMIYKLIKFGKSVDTSGIKKMWNDVKEFVKSKASTNESFVSYEEYALLEELKLTV